MLNKGIGKSFIVEVDSGGERLDVFLSSRLGISRTKAKSMIDAGLVNISGKIPKASKKVAKGDVISGVIPETQSEELKPENIPLEVVYEDSYLAVINKPAGLVVHPSPGHASGTLVNALLWRFSGMEGVGDRKRPGIVHRLDADTSGLIVVAKSSDALCFLQRAFKERSVEKRYRAVVWGSVEAPGVVDLPIGRNPVDRKKMAVRMDGREAVTLYKPISSNGSFSYLDIEIKTGRTHQIRVHMSHIGHPVVGDRLYSRKSFEGRLLLHSYRLTIPHPEGGILSVEKEEPEDFKRFLEEQCLI